MFPFFFETWLTQGLKNIIHLKDFHHINMNQRHSTFNVTYTLNRRINPRGKSIYNHFSWITQERKASLVKRFEQSYFEMTANITRITLQQQLITESTLVSPFSLLSWPTQLQAPNEIARIQIRSQMRLRMRSQRIRWRCDRWYWQFQRRKAKTPRGRLQSLRSGQLRKARRATSRKLNTKQSVYFIYGDYMNRVQQVFTYSLFMKADEQKQIELMKLKQLAPFPLDSSFITGYLAFGVPPDLAKEVKDVVEQIIVMVYQQLITSHNILELLIMLKCELLSGKHLEKKMNLAQLVEPFLNELALDNSYLSRRYFQKELKREDIVPQSMGIECNICLTDILSSDLCFISCGHMYHRNCLSEYSKEKIINKIIPFNCPQEHCKAEITSEQISEYLPRDLREKYEDFAFHNYVEKHMDDTSWCPTPGCSAVFTFDAALTDYKCPACKNHYCLACKCEFHINLSCAQYKQMANLEDDDKKFMMLVKGAKFKQCPNCKFWVEKNEGCDHMTCRCKYEFCYVCGGKYNRCKCQGFENEVEEPRMAELGPARLVPPPPPPLLPPSFVMVHRDPRGHEHHDASYYINGQQESDNSDEEIERIIPKVEFDKNKIQGMQQMLRAELMGAVSKIKEQRERVEKEKEVESRRIQQERKKFEEAMMLEEVKREEVEKMRRKQMQSRQLQRRQIEQNMMKRRELEEKKRMEMKQRDSLMQRQRQRRRGEAEAMSKLEQKKQIQQQKKREQERQSRSQRIKQAEELRLRLQQQRERILSKMQERDFTKSVKIEMKPQTKSEIQKGSDINGQMKLQIKSSGLSLVLHSDIEESKPVPADRSLESMLRTYSSSQNERIKPMTLSLDEKPAEVEKEEKKNKEYDRFPIFSLK